MKVWKVIGDDEPDRSLNGNSGGSQALNGKSPMLLLEGFQGFQPEQGQAIYFYRMTSLENVLFNDQSDH